MAEIFNRTKRYAQDKDILHEKRAFISTYVYAHKTICSCYTILTWK